MPILPIGMGDLFVDYGVRHCFILPQYWSRPSYQEIYTDYKWDTVIIDNAMYENPNDRIPVSDLIDIAEQLTATQTFVVGNEDMENGLNTIELVENELDYYGTHGTAWTYMAVLHGTPYEIVQQYAALSYHSHIGFAIAVSTYRKGYDRSGIIELAGMRGRYVHALGLDSLLEARNLTTMYNSCDSSICATAAVNRINLRLFPEIRRELECCRNIDRVDLLGTHYSEYTKQRTGENIAYITDLMRFPEEY